jgi:FkbM family methyltransferase
MQIIRTTNRYIGKLRTEGLGAILRRRYLWYLSMIRINNRTVGRLVELSGNRIRIGALKFSVNSPGIDTAHKSTLFFGLYEIDERALVERWLPKDLPVVEFGGGLGVVACMANRIMDWPDRHVVVEANPYLLDLIATNRNLNRCSFQILNRVLAYGAETAEFSLDSSFVGSRVGGSSGSTVSVPTTSLEGILNEAGYEQCSVVCDIEGAEIQLVEHEIDVIRRKVPFLLIELHPMTVGQDAVDRMIESLQDAGYRVQEKSGQNVVLVRDGPG